MLTLTSLRDFTIARPNSMIFRKYRIMQGWRNRAEQHRPYNLPSGTAGERKFTRSPIRAREDSRNS